MSEKTCTKCEEAFPATVEYFYKNNRNNLVSECKECSRQRAREYRERYPEKQISISKKYYDKNKKILNQKSREYQKNNKESIALRRREYYENNKEIIAEKNKEYRTKNAEEISKRRKASREKNKEKLRKQYRASYQRNREKILQRLRDNREKTLQREQQYIKKQPAAIYKITNRKTGTIYIGQSSHYRKRWGVHRYELRSGRHKNKKLLEDYNTYGEEAFVFEVIEELPCDTSSGVLLKKEAEQIKKHLREGKDIYNSLN